MTAATLLTVGVAVLAGSAAAAQLQRIIRVGREGVSPVTWAAVAVVSLGWSAHLVARGLVVMAAVNVALACFPVAVAVVAGARVQVAAAGAAAVGVVAAAQFVPGPVGGLLLVVATVAMFAPQAILSLRSWSTGGSAAGVPLSTWVLNAAISAAWLSWGLAANSPFTVAANIPTLGLAAAVSVLTAAAHRRDGSGVAGPAVSTRAP